MKEWVPMSQLLKSWNLNSLAGQIVSLAILFPLAASAATQSDTVPTSQLQASLAVDVVNGASQVELLAALFRVTDGGDPKAGEQLAISPDESITFSVDEISVVFDSIHSENNKLPYKEGAIYTVTYKRSNGESFSSTAKMIPAVAIVSPAAHSVFKRTEAVKIEWTVAPYDMKISSLTSKCANVEGPLSYTSNTGTIPAGYAAKCQAGAVGEHFVQVYAVKGTPLNGLRGGFAASTSAELFFSYEAMVPPESPVLQSAELPRLLMEADFMNQNEVYLEN